jgi:predicted RNase H-like HicB family nuclease
MATVIDSNMHLHVVFYCEDGDWYGHCLEFDLVESGDTIDEAKQNIIDVTRAHVEYAIKNDNMEYLFHGAPYEAWKRFNNGTPIGVERITIDNTDDVLPSVWNLHEKTEGPHHVCA